MLDDQHVIAQRDPQGMLGFVAHEPEQLAHHFGVETTLVCERPIRNIVVAGMGGSGFPAHFVTTWPGVPVPFEVSNNYELPQFVGEDTLVIACSYSGNTEETIAAITEARRKKTQLVIMSNGGKLAEIARQHGDFYIEIPHCPQPRTAALYFYRALVEVLVACKFAPLSALDDMAAQVAPLESLVQQWQPEVPQAQNYAKQLAHDMVGKSVIVYAGPKMYPAAYNWKISVNENAKNTAWCNMFPELNHNEFIGWSSHPIEKPFACLDLVSSFEHPRVIKRFAVTDRLLSGKKPASVKIEAKGDTVLAHMLYLLLLGDFATIYLAILNGVNPTPVDLVEKFKKELG